MNCEFFYFIHIFIFRDPIIPNIPFREELLRIFPLEKCKDSTLRLESETFPKFVQLLSFPCYTPHVMEGLILSIGGLTERLVRFFFVFLNY